MRLTKPVFALAASFVLWAVGATAQPPIIVNGLVESTQGGLLFPDGTIQSTASEGRAPVGDTGQTQCYDELGVVRDCYGTGEDGELQAGLAWLTPRFTDNGDGTVTDNLNELTWLKDANCPAASMTWQQALDWIGDFNTTSVACTDYTALTFTDWHLPNIRELLSLMDYGRSSPGLPPNPFVNATGGYWSSTSYPSPAAHLAQHLMIGTGQTGAGVPKTMSAGRVWPVRAGDWISHPDPSPAHAWRPVEGRSPGEAAAPLTAQTAVSADGVIESKTGGFKFPDGTIQTSAAPHGSPVVQTGAGIADCFDENGQPRNCTGTGEDGETSRGVPWTAPRFTDLGDGTVRDNLTSLIWLKDANCAGSMTWQEALDWVHSLNTTSIACTDYTPLAYDDWRLANIKELWSLIDFSESSPALPSNPFVNLQIIYWSSTTDVHLPGLAHTLHINSGDDGFGFDKDLDPMSVWPVRDGH